MRNLKNEKRAVQIHYKIFITGFMKKRQESKYDKFRKKLYVGNEKISLRLVDKKT